MDDIGEKHVFIGIAVLILLLFSIISVGIYLEYTCAMRKLDLIEEGKISMTIINTK